MILCMIAFLKHVLIVHYPHQLILTLFYQIIPDMVDIILFDVVSKYVYEHYWQMARVWLKSVCQIWPGIGMSESVHED